MAHICKKGHLHSTQQNADNCYICRRRNAKRSQKIFRQEQGKEIAELLKRSMHSKSAFDSDKG